MKIDWFTLGAQIANFLILILLLKKFLYRPVLEAMARRRESILDGIRRTEDANRAAQNREELFREKEQELLTEKEKILLDAREEAARIREKMLSDARQEADDARILWYNALEQEKEAFLKELRLRTGEKLHEILVRALTDMAGAEMEREVVRTFLEKITRPDPDRPEKQEEILRSLKRAAGRVTLFSAHEPTPEMRRDLEEVLLPLLSGGTELRYETDENLIAGLRLIAGEREISWNLRSYLGNLREEFAAILESEEGGYHESR